jgi:hypothetical protein
MAALELGAGWVPGVLRNVDHLLRSFSRFERAGAEAAACVDRCAASPSRWRNGAELLGPARRDDDPRRLADEPERTSAKSAWAKRLRGRP